MREQILAGVPETRALIVDLTDVAYLDSAALATIHRVFLASADHGLPIRVVAPDTSFSRRLLTIVGFDELIGVYATVGSALEHLGQGGP